MHDRPQDDPFLQGLAGSAACKESVVVELGAKGRTFEKAACVATC